MSKKIVVGQLVKLVPSRKAQKKIACFRLPRPSEHIHTSYNYDYFDIGELFIIELVKGDPKFDESDWSGMSQVLHPQTGQTYWQKSRHFRAA